MLQSNRISIPQIQALMLAVLHPNKIKKIITITLAIPGDFSIDNNLLSV